MLKLVALLVVLALAAGPALADNWALLVAGSNEFYNYRHQADICHAYQILHKNGIPDERIVVMMYDDIAANSENPKKGQIFNKPGGPDVYHGVVKDYTKKTVTPSNFLRILQGQEVDVGSKKIIQSGPNDNVFVFFADHGAPGIVAFPDGSALHASDLNKAIKSMYTKQQFKNLVFYIEACESGSMFEDLLPENINVFATTASNSEESSYACYYDDKIGAYLGDLYSVNWMEDSDREDISKETLQSQFETVKALTNLSHVMEYGNLTMGDKFMVSQFQAENGYVYKPVIGLPAPIKKTDAIRTEDVIMKTLEKKLEKETDMIKRDEILKQMQTVYQSQLTVISVFDQIVYGSISGLNLDVKEMLISKHKLRNHECYKPIVDTIIEKCFSLRNDYVLRHLYKMVNLCENGVDSAAVIKTIAAVCPSKFFE